MEQLPQEMVMIHWESLLPSAVKSPAYFEYVLMKCRVFISTL